MREKNNDVVIHESKVYIEQQERINTLETEIQVLKNNISELQKDLEFIGDFQNTFNKKRGSFIIELVGTIGGLVIAALVIIGLFF